MARSESMPQGYPLIGDKTKYQEYNLTRYPDAYDARDNNGNMKGFVNMQDYNMAEHVNALADAVMVMQRMLGLTPEGIHPNLTTRLNVLDQHNHDSRYGGANWNPADGQTLVGHTHTGANGHPSQIDLATEVKGLLPKVSLDLTTATGLTGDDVSMSRQDSKSISVSINDKLSTAQGGVVEKDLSVKGRLSSRLMREWDATNAGGSQIIDYATRSNTAKRGIGTVETRFINEVIDGLEYGKYVIGVRLKVSSQASQNIAYVRLYNKVGDNYILSANKNLYGTDFTNSGSWQMFYLVCDVTGDTSNSFPKIEIGRYSTTVNVDVDFDHAFIMPVTPAIFDM